FANNFKGIEPALPFPLPNGTCMKPRRPYTRHGLTAPMVRIKLAGFSAIDRRTAAARATLAFKHELIAALGGEAGLSPQRRKLIDLAARASLLLDHVDAWLFQQRSLVNARAKTLLPVLVQRQAIADHLTGFWISSASIACLRRFDRRC